MKNIYCDHCGERIWRFYYELPISNTGYGKIVCNKCMQELYKREVPNATDNSGEDKAEA